MSSSSAFDVLLEDSLEYIAEHLGPALLVFAGIIIGLFGSTSITYVAQLWSYKTIQSAKIVSIISTLFVIIGGSSLFLLALGISSTSIFGVGVGAIMSFFVLPCSTFLYDIFAAIIIFITGRVQVGEEIVFKGFIGEVHGTVKLINTTHTSILQKNGVMIDIQNSSIYSGWVSHIPHGNFDPSKFINNNSTNTNNVTIVQKPFFSL